MDWKDFLALVWDWVMHYWKNASHVFRFSYKTTSFLFEQASAVPKAIHSGFTHQPTRTVASHIVRISIEDLSFLVVFAYVNDTLQTTGASYLEKNVSDHALSANFLIRTSLLFLNSAAWIYAKRRQLQMGAHIAIVNMEAPAALTEPMMPMTLCQDQKCSTLRFLKGSLRDFITFQSTELFIELTGYLPIVGNTTAAVLSTYHHGRFITSLALPLCSRHKEHYLNEHSEFALAHGITHSMSTALITSAIQYYTGIPRVYYQSQVKQFLMLGQVSILAHMDLPSAVIQSNRGRYDPLALYIGSVNATVDIIFSGIKNQLPALIPNQDLRAILWGKIPAWAATVSTHPVTRASRTLFLPPMFQNGKQFINDPFIRDHWDKIRDQAVFVIKNIERARDNYAVKAAISLPGVLAETGHILYGVPPMFTKIVLSIMQDKTIQNDLAKLRRNLEGIHVGPPPPLPIPSTEDSEEGMTESASHLALIEQSTPAKVTEHSVLKNQLRNRHESERVRSVLKGQNVSGFFKKSDKRSPKSVLKPAQNHLCTGQFSRSP